MIDLSPWKELENKVFFLKDPHSYPHGPQAVQMIETHLSHVFIAGEFTYKIKKPNNFSFLHLGTLKERFENIQLEFHLNKALAPGYYLKVLPLLQNEEGEIFFGESRGDTKVIEWVLKMKTYPRRLCLDELIKKGKRPEHTLLKAYDKLLNFYNESQGLEIDGNQFIDSFYRSLEEVKIFTHQFGNHEKYELISKIILHQEDFLTLHRDYFFERVRNHLIVEGHGDLRPEHLCLMDDPIIVDRLEFNTKLRILDPLDELSCLDIECEMLGSHEIGEFLLDYYQKKTHDQFDLTLYYFYKINRCLIRSKLCLAHTQDQFVTKKDFWGQKCYDYLKLAEIYLDKAPGKLLEAPQSNLLPKLFSSPEQTGHLNQ